MHSHFPNTLLLLCCLLSGSGLSGQGIGINPTGQPPHPGAMLDVNAPNKGLLVPCTIDNCTSGACISEIEPNTCFIAGVCYNDGDLNPLAECQACNPADSQTGWTYLAAGTTSDAGVCDGDGSCVECLPAGECEDGIPCTIDICTAGVCITALDPTTCFIAGVCCNNGDTNPVAECQVCISAVSQTGWTNAAAGTPCGAGAKCDDNGNCN